MRNILAIIQIVAYSKDFQNIESEESFFNCDFFSSFFESLVIINHISSVTRDETKNNFQTFF